MTDRTILNQSLEKIGVALTFLSNKTPFTVVSKALDGTVYVQVVGKATPTAAVTVFVKDDAQKQAVENAAADGELLTITYKGQTHYGYIESQVEWEQPPVQGRRQGTFTFLEVEP